MTDSHPASTKRARIVESLPTPEGSFWLHLVAIEGSVRAGTVLREAHKGNGRRMVGSVKP
jgi:hypothetical protein